MPYSGGAPLIQDLIGGQIDLTFGQAANYLGPVRSGQLKAYAVLAAKRWWASPETPTIVEAGGPDLNSSFWHGLWVPKGTPKDIIAKLNAAVSQALEDPSREEALRRHRSGNLAAGQAEPGGAGGAAEGRDRTLVADHQGGRHQDAIEISWTPARCRRPEALGSFGQQSWTQRRFTDADAERRSLRNSTHIAARAIPIDTMVNATATDTASASVGATNA